MSEPAEQRSANRLVLPLVAFLFGVIALGVAAYVVLAPGQQKITAAAVGGPFRLVDQDGKPVTEAALKGKPSLIFFGFTHCPDVCPTTLQDVTQVYDALGPKADQLNSYFISVDPERDTPELLKTYLSSFDKRIVGLTGDRAAVDAATKAYRVYSRKVPLEKGDYTMDHTALVYLMDKSGQFVGAFNLQRPPAESAKDVARYF
ncbi:SCO family protein [Alsobacter sp. SYSU BS001988]|jgi:protein SCO1